MSDKGKSTILEAISAIFDRDDLDRNDKLIAIYLVRRGALTGQAFPTYASIVSECGVGRTTVSNSIKKMTQMGVIEVEGGAGNRYKYTLFLSETRSMVEPPRPDIEPGNEGSPVQNLNQTRSNAEPDPFSHRTRPVQMLNRHPKETFKDNSKETFKGNSRADPLGDIFSAEDDPADALTRLYNQYDPASGDNYHRFTARRYQEMQAALQAGASYELIANVIVEMAGTGCGPWKVREEAVRRAKGIESGVSPGYAGSGAGEDCAEQYKEDPILADWVNRGISVGT